MSGRPTPRAGGGPDRTAALASAAILLVVGGLLAGLVLVVAGGRRDEVAVAPTPSPTPAPGTFLLAEPRPAPPLALRDPDGATVDLAALRGSEVLVFFGYTHCPDVCPTTIGAVGSAIAAAEVPVRALFVSVDPERDTPAWLEEFSRFMPDGFTALTGTSAEVRATADAWGVRYARVETGSADGYAMSHTADVFLVDATGTLRAVFPFGTAPEPMTATLVTVAATTAAATVAPASPTPTPPLASEAATEESTAATLLPEIVSSSVWAGGASPVIVRLFDAAGPIDDPAVRATAQLLGTDGTPAGPVVAATVVRPPGVVRVTHVATLSIPAPGTWRLRVTGYRDGAKLTGSVDLIALDPGATARLGAPAPSVATPTAAGAGDIRLVTTDPKPDPRLSARSTAELRATGTPYVLVVDSVRFKVSPACGKAVGLARFLADRWTDVGFVHLEPYRYSLVTEMPVIEGSIADPIVTDVARAWGIGVGAWGPASVPWVFVVDGAGVVRAKYQGLVGSDDIDVILAAITGRTDG